MTFSLFLLVAKCVHLENGPSGPGKMVRYSASKVWGHKFKSNLTYIVKAFLQKKKKSRLPTPTKTNKQTKLTEKKTTDGALNPWHLL